VALTAPDDDTHTYVLPGARGAVDVTSAADPRAFTDAVPEVDGSLLVDDAGGL
jgi:hypothetical protein